MECRRASERKVRDSWQDRKDGTACQPTLGDTKELLRLLMTGNGSNFFEDDITSSQTKVIKAKPALESYACPRGAALEAEAQQAAKMTKGISFL